MIHLNPFRKRIQRCQALARTFARVVIAEADPAMTVLRAGSWVIGKTLKKHNE
jgi:hypothetical protein